MLRHFRLTCHRALFYSSTRIHEQSQVKPLFLCFGPFWNWLVRFLNPYRTDVSRRMLVSTHTLFGANTFFEASLKMLRFSILLKWKNMNVYVKLRFIKISFSRMKPTISILKYILIVLKKALFSQSTLNIGNRFGS